MIDFTNLDGAYLVSIIDEVPFDFKEDDQKFLKNDANKSGSKFKDMSSYVTKGRTYKELPKDNVEGGWKVLLLYAR
ncbi:hypothetical protein HYE05_00875 [Mycoplasmopsis bovis]|nr:hypothetical protein [Mycoplasmopsis bovis]QQH27498.1 hypothetical protein HYE05_00875 [Mycoplasmopsis bovis]